MDTYEAIIRRRSIRKFTQEPLDPADLIEIVDSARLYPSAINLQPIRFALMTEKEHCDSVFEALRWAGKIKDYKISEQERPTAYILLLSEENRSAFFDFDAGAAANAIMLLAESRNIQSCCLKIAHPEQISSVFDFQDFIPVYAIALGHGAIKSKAIEKIDSLDYYLDHNDDFCVPKRSLDEALIYSDIKSFTRRKI